LKTLEDYYQEAYGDKGNDIVEHLPYLRGIAKGKRVLELGVRHGYSTRAFLAGGPKWLVSVDKERFEYPAGLGEATRAENIPWSVLKQDSTQLILLFNRQHITFFDTLHTYYHLLGELYAHADKTSELLVFHDTVTNGSIGEDGSTPGILAAIRDFQRSRYGEWQVKSCFENCNGLMVLERVGERIGR
jgi:hypothetical protein